MAQDASGRERAVTRAIFIRHVTKDLQSPNSWQRLFLLASPVTNCTSLRCEVPPMQTRFDRVSFEGQASHTYFPSTRLVLELWCCFSTYFLLRALASKNSLHVRLHRGIKLSTVPTSCPRVLSMAVASQARRTTASHLRALVWKKGKMGPPPTPGRLLQTTMAADTMHEPRRPRLKAFASVPADEHQRSAFQ